MSKTVLVLGGYGVFGGRLSKMLVQDGRFSVVVAGRRLDRARDFCDANGGEPLEIDLQAADLRARIADVSPFLVIDAAGPFQAYGEQPYRVADAAIAAGAHYLDLADDAGFTAGIDALDDAARKAGLTALSGVSSVPALSSSAVGALRAGLKDIHLIEAAILPGNQAPRGLSVMRAILSQAGAPLALCRGSRWVTQKGWASRKTIDLQVDGAKPLRGRWASLIGAPDLQLFPTHFGARSVVFRAGLELRIMHGGLGALAWLVRLRLLRSLAPLAPLLKAFADLLRPFGTDRGGMLVRVLGEDASGVMVERHWSLIVEAGDGPSIPAIPALVMTGKLGDGAVPPGARPCLEAFSLDEAEAALGRLTVSTGRRTRPHPPLFEPAIGKEAFRHLPRPIQELHRLADRRHWRGEANIIRGKGILSRLAGRLAGFPPAGSGVPVEVSMQREGGRETWVRDFGEHAFRSRIGLRRGGKRGIIERFGLMAFDIALEADAEGLAYPVVRGRVLGVPLPGFLLPRSETREHVDGEGRACFDVSISLPLAGHVVSYRGWLVADEAQPNPPPT
ncbi:MAG: DUF4166 domain-containing protein [Henriciella sp.]|uniref:SDR family oxidoreductase n=1 Tax=Henriciella sp. TaxID=1968823 RepID=UPI0032ED6242